MELKKVVLVSRALIGTLEIGDEQLRNSAQVPIDLRDNPVSQFLAESNKATGRQLAIILLPPPAARIARV